MRKFPVFSNGHRRLGERYSPQRWPQKERLKAILVLVPNGHGTFPSFYHCWWHPQFAVPDNGSFIITTLPDPGIQLKCTVIYSMNIHFACELTVAICVEMVLVQFLTRWMLWPCFLIVQLMKMRMMTIPISASRNQTWRSFRSLNNCNVKKIHLFIYLAALGSSCATWVLWLQCVGLVAPRHAEY